ncbi:hypothetical protein ACQRXC_14825 [Niallia taxi]|uniref:Uncharacterized protein n=1 Tax=Niallia taxi TaxID=2499688 RepID=A0A3S2X4E5_9BACI|nr:hypothetical protein [Niallia taxi]MDK8639455.1 hypothetical protein [Niallia taxi]MED4037514.1 hypothetical protein [Niallia taxi]RVT65024.1 hypothetical protein EM808_05805 [Niallia taxi]
MKHITAAIYISVGFLLVSFNSFDGFYPVAGYNFIVFFIFLLGIVYLVSAIKDYLRKHYSTEERKG